MAYKRARNTVLLLKLQSADGVDAEPVAATNGILIGEPTINREVSLEDPNEVGGSLDGFGDLVGGMRVNMTFPVRVKGSGAAGTPPEISPLLKISGWGEKVTSAAIPVSAEACGAGGSQVTAELGTSASTVGGAYDGMPINFTGDVVGGSFISGYATGKIATLTDDLGDTIDAGVNYQIPANVLYTPATEDIPNATAYIYRDGKVYEFLDIRGSVDLNNPAAATGVFNATLSGIFAAESDDSVPGGVEYDELRPPIFKNGKFLIDRVEAAIASVSVSNGLSIIYPENPNALEGFDGPIHTARKLTGQMDPAAVSKATRDLVADMRAGTKRMLHWRYGGTPGNRVGVTIPQALITGNNDGNRNGLLTEQVSFQPIGQDSGMHICFY